MEPLIRSTMSHVAVKFEMIARRIAQVVEAHGPVTGVASRLRVVRLSHPSRTCATRYRVEVATLRSQAMQQSKRSNLTQPERHWPLRAVCYVRFLTKGMAISFVTFLASHPVKPSAWPCGT
jgi:hypothetical protein